jgi:glucose-1-phosphate cytidylyltransferase
MVTYGDGLADVDLNSLISFHKSHGKIATLTATKAPSRYGILDMSDNGTVKSFREKVQAEWINGGFFVFNREVFRYIDPECILERAPMEKLAADGQLMAFQHNNFWIGMDTYREYEILNQMWDSGQAAWKVW